VGAGINIRKSDVHILLYADDVVRCAEDPVSLQIVMNAVYQWCTKWRISTNNTKTQVIHFRKESDPVTDYRFHLGDNHIEIVDSYRYLGLELNYSLNFSQTTEVLSKASSRSLGRLIHKYYSADGLTYDTYTSLYNPYVLPIMNYCAGVWGGQNNECASR
jgi:hypothetical protein